MTLTKWRRPNRVNLPGGCVIPIKYLTRAQIRRALKKERVFNSSDLLGYWDGRQIVINASEPVWVQIETLAHEMVHAIHDWGNWVKLNYSDRMQAEAGLEVLADFEEEEE